MAIFVEIAIQIAIAITVRVVTNLLSPATKGPRLSDLKVTTSTFGVGITRVFGEAIRIAGNMFWSSGIIERRHKKGGFLTPKQVTYTYVANFAIGLADRSIDEGPIEAVPKLWANGKVIFDASLCVGSPTSDVDGDGRVMWRKYTRANKTHSLMASVTFYYGSFEQPVDPTIESGEGASLGVGETPAYRGTVHFVIELLQLETWGGATPNIEALVQNKTGQTLAEVVGIVCGDAGIDVRHDISSSALVDRVVRGYAVNGVGLSCWECLSPLQQPFGFSVADNAGQLRFINRAHSITATIPADDMAGHAYGDERPAANRFARANTADLPKEASLTFIDPARDYQANTQSDRRLVGSTKSNIAMDLPLVLTEDEGRHAVGQMLWEAHAGQVSDRFVLTKRWLHLQAGRIYAIMTSLGLRPFRVERRTRGANDLIEIEAIADESVVYTYQPAGAAAPTPDNPLETPGATDTQLLDIPIVDDGDDDDGFYFLADGGETWRGAIVERSTDAGASYDPATEHDEGAVSGIVTGVMPAGPEAFDGYDETTVLRVTLTNPGETLESRTDAQLLAGFNLCAIGSKAGLWELAQFGVATLITPGVYDLSHWRRGLKGTFYKIDAHVAAEVFVLLDRSTLQRQDYTAADWSLSRTYRATPTSGTPDTPFTFTNTGEGRRPIPPAPPEGVFAGDDLTLDWIRQSRFSGGEIGTDVPEAYEVDIYDTDGVTLLDTKTAATPTLAYSGADQVTDGLTAGGLILGKLYQVNTLYGRSRPRPFSFSGPAAGTLDDEGGIPFVAENGFTTLEVE